MTKDELISLWKYRLGDTVTAAALQDLLGSFCAVIGDVLSKGGYVRLPGIGKLACRESKPRRARNPRSGELFEVPAGRRVAFNMSSKLKEKMRAEA